MKVKKFQTWKVVKYGGKEFKFWSLKIKGEGNETTAKNSSAKDWDKIIVLQPIGEPMTTFSMGFSSVFGDTKVSNVQRRVEEGPFGMRMGTEDCDFFIVSNKSEVSLRFARYADIADKAESGLALY